MSTEFISAERLRKLNKICYISGVYSDFVRIRNIDDDDSYICSIKDLTNQLSPSHGVIKIYTGSDIEKHYLRGVLIDYDLLEFVPLNPDLFTSRTLTKCLGEYLPYEKGFGSAYSNGTKERDSDSFKDYPASILVGYLNGRVTLYLGNNKFREDLNQANVRYGKYNNSNDYTYNFLDINFTDGLEEFINNSSYLPLVFDYSNHKDLSYKMLSFKYYDCNCDLLECSMGVIIPKGTEVSVLKSSNFVDKNVWVKNARLLYTDSSNRTTFDLLFDSRNRAATFIYCNAVRSTVSFSEKSNLDIRKDENMSIENLSLDEKRAYAVNILAEVNREEQAKLLNDKLVKKDDNLVISNFDDFLEEVHINDSISVDDLIERKGLDWYNVHSCIDTIAGNKIPVLVGLAGAGKTYTLDNMCEIIHKYKEDCGSRFEKMFKFKIPCSNISHNDFWGSFDAVSHVCVGKFKYIWQLAEENADTLYYVILDELLDMYDIRKTFGDSFSMLTSLPNNLVVVGTGNKDVFDVSNETARNMMRDSGILGRFNLIEVSNILQDVNSESFNYFFDKSIKTETPLEEHIKNFVIKLTSESQFKNKMLVPRNVIDFIKRGSQYTSEDEFVKLMKYYIKQDSNYIKKLLFVDKPVVEKDTDNSVDLFEGLWNAQ